MRVKNVLEGERFRSGIQSAKVNPAHNRATLIGDLVTKYKALGGGWNEVFKTAHDSNPVIEL
jgi:hypothetical protein